MNRSQHQNRAMAMAVLQSRLDQLEIARQAQMNAQHTQSLTDISWGNQIRSYVLHVIISNNFSLLSWSTLLPLCSVLLNSVHVSYNPSSIMCL